jgi:two-component system sensor histidine kinase AtoS
MLKRIPIFWKLNAAFVLIFLLFLVAGYFLAGLQSVSSERYLPIILAVVIALMLSCGSIWFLVSRFIKRPIRGLVKGMNELANKKFDFRLEEDEQDEFGSLAASFNDMADMLSSSLTELKKNRDYLEGILEGSADIIITVNATGKIQTINAGAEKVLGYQRFEVIGKSIEILFADPHERRVAAEKLKYSENAVNYETQFMTNGGEVRDVLLTLSRLRNPTGAIIGTIGIGKDITEEKRLQNKLMQSQRFAAIGQVFTGIQHSMKNMLNACKGGAYMVKIGLAKDNRKMLEEGWEIVQVGITGLTKMSLDMLQYVKEFKPTVGRVDLSETLSEIYRVIKPTAKDKGVEFQLDIPASLPAVVCDARMIHSAALDIVSNALDACLWKEYSAGETPQVVISAHTAPGGRELVIEIKDNGCGMTEKVKANIFTPFFTTKSKSGTGLGLSIASRMINVHGGKIEVESEPDQGTVFQIVLPLDGEERNKEGSDGKKGFSN